MIIPILYIRKQSLQENKLFALGCNSEVVGISDWQQQQKNQIFAIANGQPLTNTMTKAFKTLQIYILRTLIQPKVKSDDSTQQCNLYDILVQGPIFRSPGLLYSVLYFWVHNITKLITTPLQKTTDIFNMHKSVLSQVIIQSHIVS